MGQHQQRSNADCGGFAKFSGHAAGSMDITAARGQARQIA
jgi:hypothetical protein